MDEFKEVIKVNTQFFTCTDKNKETLTKKGELWDGIKNLIKKINDKLGEYGKDFMKMKFISDDNFPLNEILKHHNLRVTIRSVFQENSKYCRQIFLDEFLHELQKCYNMK